MHNKAGSFLRNIDGIEIGEGNLDSDASLVLGKRPRIEMDPDNQVAPIIIKS